MHFSNKFLTDRRGDLSNGNMRPETQIRARPRVASRGRVRAQPASRGRAIAQAASSGRARAQAINRGRARTTEDRNSGWREVDAYQHTAQNFGGNVNQLHNLDETATSIEYFDLMLGNRFFDGFVHHTNLNVSRMCPPVVAEPGNIYAHSHPSWQLLTRDEAKAFIGMNILMGIKSLPEYADYWSSSRWLGVPEVANIMTKNRYEEILRFMCLNTPPVSEEEKADKLHKVRPLVDLTSENFASSKPAGEAISIDEAMIKHNGYLKFKQYMKNKPTKWGMKVFMANDAQTGYCFKYRIYTGKGSIPDPTNSGQSHAIVTALLADYIGGHRKVYMDNWFSSVGLAEYLYSQQTYLCGTARKNRLPPICSEPIGVNQVKYYLCDSKDLLVTHWHDKRDVYIMSTCCNTGSHELQCWRNKERAVIQRPDAVKEYNEHMGGTDKFDQMRAYYNVGRTGRKWWRYILWGLINFSIVNAHVLWREQLPVETAVRKKSLKEFKLSLLDHLIGDFSSRKRPTGAFSGRPVAEYLVMNVHRNHSLVKFAGRKRACVGCKEQGNTMANGKPKETIFGCTQCNTNMCKTCFNRKHDGMM